MATKEKPLVDEVSGSSKENVLLKCGDCLHFDKSPHPKYGEVCKLRGVRSFGTAPNCYTANINVFRGMSLASFSQLGVLVSSLSPQQSRVLMGLLKTRASLGKRNLTFLQKVYFSSGSGDYLDQYFAAYVMGLGPDGEILLVGEDYLKNSRSPIIAQMDRRSLLTAKEFKKRRIELQESGCLSSLKRITPQFRTKLSDEEYEPPTIETSADALEQKAAASSSKKKVRVLEVKLSPGE